VNIEVVRKYAVEQSLIEEEASGMEAKSKEFGENESELYLEGVKENFDAVCNRS
jgi:hypothetical protein